MLRPEDYRRLMLGEFENRRPEGEALVARYVDAVAAVHPSGRGYFDRLDRLVGRDPAVLGALTELVQETYGTRVSIVASGQFGLDYRDWARYTRQPAPALVLPGGLRHKPEPTYADVREYRHRLLGSHFDCVFIDDSLYRGRTMNWARELILMSGRRYVGAVVAYDGSRTRQPNVHSLYRYFDFHVPE